MFLLILIKSLNIKIICIKYMHIRHAYNLNSSHICVYVPIFMIFLLCFKLVVPKRLTERIGQLMNINR